MSAGVQSVAFWGLQVPAGGDPTIAASEIPGVHMACVSLSVQFSQPLVLTIYSFFTVPSYNGCH